MQRINVPSDLLTASLLVTVTPGHWGKSQTRSARNEGETVWTYSVFWNKTTMQTDKILIIIRSC
jgi:hypothetical protein